MCGIPPVRDGRYIRPLLGFTGKEVRSICQESSIRFVLDSTNAEDDYTRNRIRQRIVPEISTLSPAVQNAVLRMCSSLREDSDFIDNAANEFPLEKGTANQAALAQLHPAVRSRVLQRMWHLASGKKVCALEAVHIRDISTLLGKGGTFRLSTPGGLTFYADGGYARFVSLTDNQPADIDECEYVIEPGNGSIILNGYAVTVTLVFPQDIKSVPAQYDENIYNLSINKSVSFDKIKGKLMLRTRRPGDVLRYGGMSRSVKKLMSSGHIPFDERARLPVFSDDEGIVWIPGFPVRDGMKPSVGERCIVINIHREGAE